MSDCETHTQSITSREEFNLLDEAHLLKLNKLLKLEAFEIVMKP